MKNVVKKISCKVKNCCNYIDEQWNEFINQKYLKILFKVLPHNLFIFILFIISLFTILKFYHSNSETVLYNQSIANSVIDPIMVDPVNISFDNVELNGTPTDLCLTFATYARVNNSNFKFVLYKDEDVVSETQFNANALKDGSSYCFNTPTINDKNIHEYSAKIIPIYSDSANAITLYKNSINNQFAMKFISHNRSVSVRNMIILIFVLLFLIINYLINKKEYKPEKFWILISIIYLISIMFIIPPYQVPDEPVHFWNAYKITQIDFSKSLADNFTDQTVETPLNIGCLNYSHIQTVDRVNDFNSVIDCAGSTDNETTWSSYISSGTKLGYIFSAIGIKIADILTNSPLIIFYAGRLFNLLASIIIIFFAIKTTPKYKNVFLFIATIPMFIQQMGSYSYDSTLNAICLLSLAIILKMIFSSDNRWILDTIVLTICAIFIANIKMIYLPILLFALLIPKEKFNDKKIIKFIYPIIIIILAYFISYLFQHQLATTNGLVSNLIPDNTNSANVLANPMSIFPIALKTFKVNGWFYIQSLVGYFGWFRYQFPTILIFAYLLYFIYLVCTEEKINGKWYLKLLIIIGILVSVAGIFGSMYFGWSADGLDYVDGVQGRYFIPLLLPILLLTLSQKNELKYEKKINDSYNFINIMVLQYIIILLMFYY